MRRYRHRTKAVTAAALALLAMLAACSSDQVSHSISAALRGWCQNTPEHCSLAADSR
jgi:hypothetical protein